MASSIRRTLTNLYHNQTMAKFFNSIKNLESKSPIPNQALPIAINSENKCSTLYFVGKAVKNLDFVSELAHTQTLAREKSKKNDREIEFYCTGYVDSNGDYIVNDLVIPSLEFFRNKEKKTINFDKLFLTKLPKDIHTDTTSDMIDYLRHNNIQKDKSKKQNFALYGTTKSSDKYGNDRTCPTLGNIADAIVPGDVIFDYPITTGVLVVTPKVLNRKSKGQYEFSNGSLECTIVNYRLTPSGFACPVSLNNVAKCEKELHDGKTKAIDICKSTQDTTDFPDIRLSDYERTK